MSYFPVDDQSPFHPKFIRAGNAAIGLWTRAGAWSKQQTSGGRVDRDVALSMGTATEIRKLVTVNLWHAPGDYCNSPLCPSHHDVDEDNYTFHDWYAQTGNGTGEEERNRRDTEKERARQRKAAQRAREKADRDARASVPPQVTPTVTDASHRDMRDSHTVVTDPPVPVPLTTDLLVPHVGNREASVTDEGSADEVLRVAAAALLPYGITDIKKIQLRIAAKASRAVSIPATVSIISGILDRGQKSGRQIGSGQAYVMGAIGIAWAEIQQEIDSRPELQVAS